MIDEIGVGDPVLDVDGDRSPPGRSSRSWTCTGTAGGAGTARSGTPRPAARPASSTASRSRRDEGLLGGWSEYIHLRPGVHIVPLPPELDWRAFLSAGCGMPTALHAVSLGEVQFGDTVLVQGAGPVGLSAAVLAQLRGAGQVIVIGGPEVRLSAARRFGADTTIDIATTTEQERLDGRPRAHPAAAAPTSPSRRPASRPPCRKACGSPATPAGTWSSGSTRTSATRR